jgi:hypothetical protein
MTAQREIATSRGEAVGRARRLTVAAVVTLLLAAVGGCTTPPGGDGSGSGGIHVDLVAGGFELSWPETAAGQSWGYELQYRTETGTWTEAATVSTNSYTFTDVTTRTTYFFRMRSGVPAGAAPATFGSAVSAVYVEPVLPIVRITTTDFKPILDKETYVPGTISIDPNGSAYTAYTGSMGIKGRGNSTWNYQKKPYKVKLDSKSPIMGMPTEKDWVLLANYLDRSQLRTWAAMEMSAATDLAWTPRCRHVEVVLNGSYQGAYQLCEQVEVSSARVGITEMDEDDNLAPEVTGGYLMELDARLEENHEPGWRTSRNVPIVVKDPEPPTTAQWVYIRGFVDAFEQHLFSPQYTDPVLGYDPYLDVDAFIDHWIVQEVTRNGDSFWSSTYFTKQRADDQLVFGPVWDFDRSMGSPWTERPQPPEGWYARDHGPWVYRLFTDPAFVSRVHDRWDELAPVFGALAPELEALGAELRPAIDNDAARWHHTMAPEDEPEFLADWLTARVDWMTAAFAAE